MAKVEVTPQLLTESLFPGASVNITGVGMTQSGNVILFIEGISIPNAEQVTAKVTVHERSVTTEFKAVDTLIWPGAEILRAPAIAEGEEP